MMKIKLPRFAAVKSHARELATPRRLATHKPIRPMRKCKGLLNNLLSTRFRSASVKLASRENGFNKN